MKIRVAYIEEPPFYWTSDTGAVVGSDIELAEAVLRAIGISEISYIPTKFEELLSGVEEGRWDINVPIFISAEREHRVAFSSPVWSLVDGFIVHGGNPKKLTSYRSLASQPGAHLAVIGGTVQIDAAKAEGVGSDQIVIFKDQPAAIAALQAGTVDAYVGTAVGNRALLKGYHGLEAVTHPQTGKGGLVGGFSFNKGNLGLIRAVNEQLELYLGSADHRNRMKKYGIADEEIDGALSSSN